MKNQFNVIDVYKAVKFHKKFILGFVFGSILLTSIILFFVPKQFKAQTIIVPANPNLADLNRLSANSNIQHLYPFFGSDGDQDILIGFFKLPQLYKHLTLKFKLTDYYNIHKKSVDESIYNASEQLFDEIEVIKNENNQVKITLWMKNAKLASHICNEAVIYTNELIKHRWQLQNKKELDVLNTSIDSLQKKKITLEEKLRQIDIELKGTFDEISEIKSIETQLNNLETYKNKISLALQTTPNALYVVEEATITPIAEKPKAILILFSTFITSIAFSILLVVAFNKKP